MSKIISFCRFLILMCIVICSSFLIHTKVFADETKIVTINDFEIPENTEFRKEYNRSTHIQANDGSEFSLKDSEKLDPSDDIKIKLISFEIDSILAGEYTKFTSYQAELIGANANKYSLNKENYMQSVPEAPQYIDEDRLKFIIDKKKIYFDINNYSFDDKYLMKEYDGSNSFSHYKIVYENNVPRIEYYNGFRINTADFQQIPLNINGNVTMVHDGFVEVYGNFKSKDVSDNALIDLHAKVSGYAADSFEFLPAPSGGSLDKTVNGKITAKSIDIIESFNQLNIEYNKVYDGSDIFTTDVILTEIDKLISGEIAFVRFEGKYDSKNVGNRSLTINFILDGADKDNYNFTNSSTLISTAKISSMHVSPNFSLYDRPIKVYDTTADCAIEVDSKEGLIASDDVKLIYYSYFLDIYAGENKKYDIKVKLQGKDALNYIIDGDIYITKEDGIIKPREIEINYNDFAFNFKTEKYYDSTNELLGTYKISLSYYNDSLKFVAKGRYEQAVPGDNLDIDIFVENKSSNKIINSYTILNPTAVIKGKIKKIDMKFTEDNFIINKDKPYDGTNKTNDGQIKFNEDKFYYRFLNVEDIIINAKYIDKESEENEELDKATKIKNAAAIGSGKIIVLTFAFKDQAKGELHNLPAKFEIEDASIYKANNNSGGGSLNPDQNKKSTDDTKLVKVNSSLVKIIITSIVLIIVALIVYIVVKKIIFKKEKHKIK